VVVHPVQQGGQVAVVVELIETSGPYDVFGAAEITRPFARTAGYVVNLIIQSSARCTLAAR
jgi:hypothetical protein